MYSEARRCFIGLLACQFPSPGRELGGLQGWIETFFLLETTLRPLLDKELDLASESYRVTERITALFEVSIRNVASHDEWHSTGRKHFFRRVLNFVIRNERIDFGLPAFPCKSPNTRKVGGSSPDMAEQMALVTLRTFAMDIQKLYPPGGTLWVISDGHVFSDCIGVDDDVVAQYDDDLQNLYHTMFPSPEDRKLIRFRGLTDMFFDNPVMSSFSQNWISEVSLPHPILTTRSSSAETARKLMMAACEIDRPNLRKLITSQDPSVLPLYRGQSRFMLDDLAVPSFLTKSTKQKKKIASEVAAEMIVRNQAYSNLLEMLIPDYVRLSIHAHTNAGPKFGIRLFPKDKVKAIDSIENRHELHSAYEFQLPTPWHNSMIKIEGDSIFYLGKAEIVRSATKSGDYDGDWVEGPDGGHFALKHTSHTVVEIMSGIDMMQTAAGEKKLSVTTEVMEVEPETDEEAPLTKTTRIQLTQFLPRWWYQWWYSPIITFQFRFFGRVFHLRTGLGV
ncbi:hypothetical protein K491DRAFT_776343 [Lophiostoma macrostomum CBS 122681]|uniref:Pyoverdine/dityrosine biosynthesis protein n=1 Tax=Lophiostoma macrostomum CBS 122681 TaxID=1314788 RepID=A0A6A6TER1_9PLEO|nr:hypothetical protein K491DRAFT_776343 [Lophiostoma macrostomum CBS 122681]